MLIEDNYLSWFQNSSSSAGKIKENDDQLCESKSSTVFDRSNN